MTTQIDEGFLTDCGLASLSAEDSAELLRVTRQELELRVGTRLSHNLSDRQLEEFEAFMDGKLEVAVAWIEAHRPGYLQDDVYRKLRAGAPAPASDREVLCQYASMAWLEDTRPDFRQVVAEEHAVIKRELIRHRDAILGS